MKHIAIKEMQLHVALSFPVDFIFKYDMRIGSRLDCHLHYIEATFR